MSEQNKQATAGGDKPTERVLPDPLINPESQRFFDAAAQRKLLIGHCKDCGRYHFYPRALCPHCLSDKTDWVESKGEGEIYSYSVMRRGAPVPYALAYVRLDEGTTMLANIVDCDLDALAIGQRVSLTFVATASGTLVPAFKPA